MTPHSAAAHSAPSCHASALTVASQRSNSVCHLLSCRGEVQCVICFTYPSRTCSVVGTYWSLIVGFLPVWVRYVWACESRFVPLHGQPPIKLIQIDGAGPGGVFAGAGEGA